MGSAARTPRRRREAASGSRAAASAAASASPARRHSPAMDSWRRTQYVSVARNVMRVFTGNGESDTEMYMLPSANAPAAPGRDHVDSASAGS